MTEQDLQRVSEAFQCLERMTTRQCDMGWEDIEDLCSATRLLADTLGLAYNDDTDTYEPVAPCDI